jgi:hypothetical protein
MDRDLVPIGIERRYFSARLLRVWATQRIGTRFTIAELSRVLGWSPTATRYILRGWNSPTLESYCRALARVEEPFGTWISKSGN